MGGPHPYYRQAINKEMMATQNRVEELLLSLVMERLATNKPPSKDDYEKDDREAAERGYPISEIEKAKREGYDLGWWDAVEQLNGIIEEINENNQYRITK